MYQELERSVCAPEGTGRVVKPEGKTNEGHTEVGSAHSSLRAGKPSTWRRGWQLSPLC